MDENEKMQEEVRKLERRVDRKQKLLTFVIVLWLVNAVLSFNTQLDMWAMIYHQKEVSKIRDEQVSLIEQIISGHEELDAQLEDFSAWLKENGGKDENKFIAVILTASVLAASVAGCGAREASRVSYNISQEADNFNVIRRLVVINARTDRPMFELVGAFSFKLSENRITATVETGP